MSAAWIAWSCPQDRKVRRQTAARGHVCKSLNFIAVEQRIHWHNHGSGMTLEHLVAKRDDVLHRLYPMYRGGFRARVVLSTPCLEYSSVRNHRKDMLEKET